MSQLQYIGARYVPIWYVNSVDQTADWEVNVEYEPLTWVTTPNNHLYLSKKTVPDNIGTPAQNTEYWLDMGEFTNAQIAELQEQVDDIEQITIPAIESHIDAVAKDVIRADGAFMGNDIKNKRFIFMGDSYAQGAICTNWTGDFNTATYTRNYSDGWMSKLITILGLDSDHAIASPTGGASFALTGGQHWQDLLTTLGGTVTDPDTVDYIVVMGGANDFGETASAISNGMAAFKLAQDQYFPNATVLIGMIGNTNRYYAQANILKTFNAYQEGCRSNGFIFMTGMENISHFSSYMGLDFLHLTANAYTAIARNAADFIRSGSVDFKASLIDGPSDVIASWGSNLNSSVATCKIAERIDNGMGQIEINALTVTIPGTSSTSFACGQDVALVVKDEGFSLIGNGFPPSNYGQGGAIIVVASRSTGLHVYPGTIALGDRFIYISAFGLSNNNWQTISDAYSIQVYAGTITMPLITSQI